MPVKALQQIKQLTAQAAKLLEGGEIIGCNEVLAQRQQLLTQTAMLINTLAANDPLKEEFIELLQWVQQYDQPAMLLANQLKKVHHDKVVKQHKTKHAITKYRNSY